MFGLLNLFISNFFPKKNMRPLVIEDNNKIKNRKKEIRTKRSSGRKGVNPATLLLKCLPQNGLNSGGKILYLGLSSSPPSPGITDYFMRANG